MSAGEESAVNQRASGIWAGYVGVLLGSYVMKYVSGYHNEVREMYVLAKDLKTV